MNTQFKKGQIPWNKGKHTGIKPWLGKKRSPDTIQKIINTKKSNNQVGEKAANWKGGRISDGSGYILIYSPNHPYKKTRKYVLEHRLVMEKHIGRYLTRTEVVHHINDIKDDNRIENLVLLKNNAEHISKTIFGSMHHATHLTEEDVIKIRERHKRKERLLDIANSYKISRSTVKDIVSRRCWTHI